DVDGAGSGRRCYLNIRVASDAWNEIWREVRDDIHLMIPQRGHPGCRIRDEAEDERLYLRNPSPVLGVGLKRDPIVLYPGLEDVGARANRMRGDIARTIRLVVARRHDTYSIRLKI